MRWDAASTKCGLSLIRLGQAENTAERAGIGTQTEGDSEDKVLQLRLMGGMIERKEWGMEKVLLTHFTLQVLEVPVQDDTSHQCRRQIHLYIDWTKQKRIGLNKKIKNKKNRLWRHQRINTTSKPRYTGAVIPLWRITPFTNLQTKSPISSWKCEHISKNQRITALKLHGQPTFRLMSHR